MGLWNYLSAEEVLKELKSSEGGLSREEALKRVDKNGFNELKQKKKESSWKKLARQFTSFLVLILIAAMVLSFASGHIVDTIMIAVIVLLNGFLGFAQEYKAEKAIEALKKMSTPTAVVLRNNKEEDVPTRELVPGDVILLEAGSIIPADCRVISSSQLKVDESSLTGESVPVSKSSDTISENVPLGEMKNMIFMGTYVTYGTAKAVVLQTGMKTELGKIAEMVQEDGKKTPLQIKLDQFGKQIGVLVIVIAFAIAALGILRGNSAVEMFMTGASIAVAAVPEGLPAIVTITLALGMQRMAKKKAIVRKLPAIETLGSTNVICSDKTGTITKNEMTVTDVFVDGRKIQVTGAGYSSEGQFLENEKPAKKSFGLDMLMKISSLCNNASVENGKLIGDPTEGALTVAAEKYGIGREVTKNDFPKIAELPFDSVRKMMTTVHKKGSGCEAYTKGAPEMVINKCSFMLKEGKKVKITLKDKEKIEEQANEMASKALRVLAFAFKEVPKQKDYPSKTEEGLVFVGLAGMIDPPREEAKNAIMKCKHAGIRVMMLTGDYPVTAKAIAMKVGLAGENDEVVSGQDIENMSDSELSKKVDKVNVFARISPEHKMKIVEILQGKGNVVAVTGDGVNDAPALKKADIGVAMGIRGTDVSKEVSDMILTDDNFASIVNAVEEGRGIYANIRKFVNFLLSCNLAEVMIILFAIIIGWPLPLTAVMILWVNLITDGMPALALSVDNNPKDLMKRPPKKESEGIINRSLLFNIFYVSILITAGVLLLFAWSMMRFQALEGKLYLESIQSVAFTAVIVTELVRLQAIRREYKLGLFSNKYLVIAVGASFALHLAVLYTPLSGFFGTQPLGFTEWAAIIIVSAVIYVLSVAGISLKNRTSWFGKHSI